MLRFAPPGFSRGFRTVLSQGEDGVEEFLICKNRNCRFLISLLEGNRLLRRSELILSACPEGDHEWSGCCPFCSQALTVIWKNKVPNCAHCTRPLQPEALVE